MPESRIILIVDDIPENLRVLGRMLEHEGHTVLVATSGAMALKIVLNSPRPDLILLDIMMPDLDGYEVCRRLKSAPETEAIPVIFVSGLLETLDKVAAFRAGGVDYITKPFQFEEVLARVRTHLMLRRQQERLANANSELRRALAGEEQLNRKLIEINEKLRTSEQPQTRFLAAMRSWFKRPRASIAALAAGIAGGGLAPEEVASQARAIQAQAFELDFQMGNIFLAAELEAGDTQPQIAPVAVGAALREAIRIFTPMAREHSLELRLADDGRGDILFPSDGEMLQQILANLLSNAIKFSLASGVVSLSSHVEGETLVLAVEDQGSGIPEESRAAIFTRFRRLNRGDACLPEGNGLGLSVVKALLDLMGGEIRLSPGAAGGARFTVLLPRLPAAGECGNGNLDDGKFEER